MALLENLKPGHVYLVKVSASNSVGDGPFSNVVELSVRADPSSGRDPRLSRGSTYSTGQYFRKCLPASEFKFIIMRLLVSDVNCL